MFDVTIERCEVEWAEHDKRYAKLSKLQTLGPYWCGSSARRHMTAAMKVETSEHELAQRKVTYMQQLYRALQV